MHYCPICGNVMWEYNNYGRKTLSCKVCGQEIAYGHKDPEKDREMRREPEVIKPKNKE